MSVKKVKKEDYISELGKCLKKESVDELDRFMQSHKDDIGEDVVKRFNEAPYEVKRLTLWKMILARTDMPTKLKEKVANEYANYAMKTGRKTK